MASNNDIEMEVIKKEPKEEEETTASEDQEQDLILNCEVKNENVKTEGTTAKDDQEQDFLLNCEVKNDNVKMEETTAKDDPDEMVNGRVPNVRLKTNVTSRRPYGKARLDKKHLRIIKKYGVRNKRELWRINCTLRETHEAARELLTPEEEKARFDQELRIIDKYGLRNKRELWRAKCTLSKTHKAARELQEKGLFRDHVLLRRLVRVGVLHKDSMKLVYVLALKIEDFLERRLQTVVFKMGLAKSIHQAGVLIRQRHIRVCDQVVKSPSYIVPLECQKHINISLQSPFGGACAGRIKRKNLRKSAAGGVVEEEED